MHEQTQLEPKSMILEETDSVIHSTVTDQDKLIQKCDHKEETAWYRNFCDTKMKVWEKLLQ